MNFSNLIKGEGMAFRLAAFAARRRTFVRSTVFFSVSREADDCTRIDGARNNGNQLEFISAIERKPDVIVYSRRDDDRCGNFGAYNLEEDGSITMSPKYSINPPSFLLEHYSFGASCSGLFYFRGPRLGHALWNPTTCEYKLFRKPDDEPPPLYIYKYKACGMWCDNGLQDCKVVNLVHSCLEDDRGLNFNSLTFHLDLYSLKTNLWKRIPCPNIRATSQACISGILYYALENTINCFDISTETFSLLHLPNDSPPYFFSQILEYKGLLSAFTSDWPNGKYHLWVMRNGYNWTREVVFRIPFDDRKLEPIWFSQDGKLLYFKSLRDGLFVFDFGTGKLKHLDVNTPMSYPKMFPFVDNFVQLHANFNAISCIE